MKTAVYENYKPTRKYGKGILMYYTKEICV